MTRSFHVCQGSAWLSCCIHCDQLCGEDVKFEPLIKGNYKLVLTNVDKDSKDALSPYEARMYVVD